MCCTEEEKIDRKHNAIYLYSVSFILILSFSRRLLFACIARDNILYRHLPRFYIYTSHRFAEFFCFYFGWAKTDVPSKEHKRTQRMKNRNDMHSRVRKEDTSMNANNAQSDTNAY